MALTLPTLATELVELVSHFLERIDLLSLRLVNKELHQKSCNAFHSLFTTIRTDLSLTSLEKIQAISTHGLGLHVRNLLLEAGDDDAGEFGHDAQWSRHSFNNLDMLSPGPQMLQTLLTRDLVNCRSFHIYIPGGTEDESHTITPSDAVGLILLLIPSLPIRSPIRSFAISSRSHGTSFLDVKRLPIAQCDQAPFLRTWTHIQELILEQTLTYETFIWSLNLVLHAPNLRTLSLNLGFDQSEAFIERLCVAESTPLESLSLRCGHTTVANMSHLIEKSRGTLRALSLQQISLSRFSDWRVVLERLKSQVILLESISVHWLTAYDDEPRTLMVFPSLVNDHLVPGSEGRSVTCRTKRWKGEKRIVGVNYRGPSVDEALRMLMNSAEAI